MLRALIKKLNIEEMMGIVRREENFQEKNQKEITDLKISVTDMKNVLIWFINTPDIAKEKISELYDRSLETSQAEMQRKNGQ